MTEYNRAEIDQAVAAWREDEDKALAGQCLSAETRAESFSGHVRVTKNKLQRLAEEHPELFMGLMDTVSPLSQDVLIQYFILRRTQEQIGMILGVTPHGLHYILGKAMEELKGGRKPTKKDFVREKVELKRERWLGAAEIPIDEDVLGMCFQLTNGNE